MAIHSDPQPCRGTAPDKKGVLNGLGSSRILFWRTVDFQMEGIEDQRPQRFIRDDLDLVEFGGLLD